MTECKKKKSSDFSTVLVHEYSLPALTPQTTRILRKPFEPVQIRQLSPRLDNATIVDLLYKRIGGEFKAGQTVLGIWDDSAHFHQWQNPSFPSQGEKGVQILTLATSSFLRYNPTLSIPNSKNAMILGLLLSHQLLHWEVREEPN